MVDKQILENPEKSPFSQSGFIRTYLQLFWDPENNKIYEDINLFAASRRGVMPIASRIEYNLVDDSEISLTSSA